MSSKRVKGPIEADGAYIKLKSGATEEATIQVGSNVAAATFTLPATTDTLVGRATSDTLTNKTIDGDDNTISDLSLTSFKTEAGDANKALVRDGSGNVVSALITNDNIDASAAIAVSKLAALTPNVILATDASGFLTSTSVTESELNALSGIDSNIQDQLDGKQATGNYITALTGDVTASGPGSAAATIAAGAINNDKIAANAAVALSKLAAVTASRVLVSDGNGTITPSSVTATTLGYLDATSSVQTQLDAKASSSSLSSHTGASSGVHGVSGSVVGTSDTQTLTNKTINGADNTLTVRLANDVTGTLPIANGGTGQTSANAALNALLPDQSNANGKVLGSNGTSASWVTPLTNPMTTAGDLIIGGSSGAATRLALGSANTVFKSNGTTPSWGQITNADVSASAAIAGSKINPSFGAQAISSTASQNRLGHASGNASNTTPSTALPNILFYNVGDTNWAGMGTDTAGGVFIVNGSASPKTKFYISPTSNSITLGAAGSDPNTIHGATTLKASALATVYHTAENTSGTVVFRLNSANGNDTYLELAKGGSPYWSIYNAQSDDSLRISGTAGSSVGVKLSQGATSWAAISDERMKTNWEYFTDALSKLSTLEVGTYNWVDNPTGPKLSGVKAQQVLRVLPEAVDTSDPDKLCVRYTELIPLLIAGIKELKADNDALKARLESLNIDAYALVSAPPRGGN